VSDVNADGWLTDTRTSYDTVAVSYADQTRSAMAEQPYLRAALALFADMVRIAGGGSVADVGCGPGHVTAHLHELGIAAFGIDLSPVMIDVARRFLGDGLPRAQESAPPHAGGCGGACGGWAYLLAAKAAIQASDEFQLIAVSFVEYEKMSSM
jgi:SAM-dependent methyltransferase